MTDVSATRLVMGQRLGANGNRYVVGLVEEIPAGERKIVQIAGRSIGVFNVNGEFFALRNRCPHQGGPLCAGWTGAWVHSDGPGDYQRSRPGEMVRCPWHGWEFDVRTGQSWFDPAKVRVRSYEVAVERGAAIAQCLPSPPLTAAESDTAGGPAGFVKGPYVAETYPVSIERDYVVVDLGR